MVIVTYKSNSGNKASPSQRDRFIEAARALGADEDEGAFKVKLAQIARHKPRGDVPPAPKPERADKE